MMAARSERGRATRGARPSPRSRPPRRRGPEAARPRLGAHLALAFVLTLLGAAPAHAHGRSISHSSWQLDADGAAVEARFSTLDLSLLQLPAAGDGVDPVARYAADHLLLERDGKPCPLTEAPRSLPAPDGWRVFAWHLACPAGGRMLRSRLLLAEAPSHLHFARVRGSDGKVVERVLAEEDGAWAVDGVAGARSADTSFVGYVLLGITHIVAGWDHLAFVAALLLLAHTLREAVTLITAFTLSHSVALALAALGVVHPDAVSVDSLLGFSVALVAAENAWQLAGRDRAIAGVAIGLVGIMGILAAAGIGRLRPLALLGLGLFSLCHFALLDGSPRPARLRAALAFAFGLVHGFGFAAVLTRLDLPPEPLVRALVGFNVGVELGQLMVVALLWSLLRLLARRRDGRLEQFVVELGSAAICGVGLFWFLTRSLR